MGVWMHVRVAVDSSTIMYLRHPKVDRFVKSLQRERECFIDNLLVRIHFIIVMIRWTGLAPWEFEFPFPGSLASTFLGHCRDDGFVKSTQDVHLCNMMYLRTTPFDCWPEFFVKAGRSRAKKEGTT